VRFRRVCFNESHFFTICVLPPLRQYGIPALSRSRWMKPHTHVSRRMCAGGGGVCVVCSFVPKCLLPVSHKGRCPALLPLSFGIVRSCSYHFNITLHHRYAYRYTIILQTCQTTCKVGAKTDAVLWSGRLQTPNASNSNGRAFSQLS
jgi:hypothetical protein